jgi:hypothetical protein
MRLSGLEMPKQPGGVHNATLMHIATRSRRWRFPRPLHLPDKIA